MIHVNIWYIVILHGPYKTPWNVPHNWLTVTELWFNYRELATVFVNGYLTLSSSTNPHNHIYPPTYICIFYISSHSVKLSLLRRRQWQPTPVFLTGESQGWWSQLGCGLLLSIAKSLQSCPTLCNPIDGSPPGSPVPGILQARTLEWVAISFSNAWKWKVKVKLLSRVWLLAISWTPAYQAPLSIGFSRQEYWSGVPLPSPMGLHKVGHDWSDLAAAAVSLLHLRFHHCFPSPIFHRVSLLYVFYLLLIYILYSLCLALLLI